MDRQAPLDSPDRRPGVVGWRVFLLPNPRYIEAPKLLPQIAYGSTQMSAEASGSHPTSEHAAHIDAQRPKRHNLTPAEQQAAAVSRLLANPDREIKLPPASKEKELRAPREMIKNVTGSSAGAGSGEFHVYKHARRREYERVKLLEERAEKVSRVGMQSPL